MKYFVNFVVLIFAIILCNSSANSNEKFAYIDIDKIMRQSKAGKSINKQLENLLSETTKKYKQIENKLKEDELKIISKQKNWNLIRWITRDDNLRAKKVYDKVANLSNWDVYELD